LFLEKTTDSKKEIHAVKLSHHRSGLLVTAALAFAFLASNAAAQAPASSQAPAKKPATAGASKTAKTGPDPALLHPATLKAQAPETFQVKFETTAGDFTVNVTRAMSPLGVDRFYNLCKHHFYDNGAFFRVVPGFVVQFGLSAYPQVNAVWDKATIKDDPGGKQTNAIKTLTFATAGPNTRTTQLFINLADNKRLDSMGFTAFGEVTDGFDVVQKIYAGYGEKPDQQEITTKGKAYLDQNFPKIDMIKTTTIIGEPAPVHHPAPAKKPAAAPAPKPQS
jgi:peptidyl-prolyl cis-trans isomerase A (cyclophilin A)